MHIFCVFYRPVYDLARTLKEDPWACEAAGQEPAVSQVTDPIFTVETYTDVGCTDRFNEHGCDSRTTDGGVFGRARICAMRVVVRHNVARHVRLTVRRPSGTVSSVDGDHCEVRGGVSVRACACMWGRGWGWESARRRSRPQHPCRQHTTRGLSTWTAHGWSCYSADASRCRAFTFADSPSI